MASDYEVIKYMVENCDSKNRVNVIKLFDDLKIFDLAFMKNGQYNRLVRAGYIAKESTMSEFYVTQKAKEYYKRNTPSA